MKKTISFLLVLAVVLSLRCAVYASWTCPDCGTKNKGNFCGSCGRSELQFERSETWFCTACGGINSSSFCTGCGEKRSEGLVGNLLLFGAYKPESTSDDGSDAAGSDDTGLNAGPEEIEWIVLAEEEDRILVLSRYALDMQPYIDPWNPCTWEISTLRLWLNDEFLNTAFSETEKPRILTTTVTADKNPLYTGTDMGKDTRDKIFLLSIDEVTKYFVYNRALICTMTPAAVAKLAEKNDDYEVGNTYSAPWWLRTGGLANLAVTIVYSNGGIEYRGKPAGNQNLGVRPAMWIRL